MNPVDHDDKYNWRDPFSNQKKARSLNLFNGPSDHDQLQKKINELVFRFNHRKYRGNRLFVGFLCVSIAYYDTTIIDVVL